MGDVLEDARLTRHALERLQERSVTEPNVILSAIQSEKIELITVEQYTNRGSYLYFSDQENAFFVLVIDMSTREVITILPIEYWENLKASGKYDRYLNEQSVSKSMLFKAIRRVDGNHEYLRYPPLFGRGTIYFFVTCYVENKYKVTRSGAIGLANLVGLEKEKCIARMQAELDFGIDSLVPDDGVFFVSWKTSNSKEFKFPESLQLLGFHTSVDFDRLHAAVITDLSRRLSSSKKFPEFDWERL